MKHIDGFVLMRLSAGSAERLFWDLDNGMEFGFEPIPENWLSDYRGGTNLAQLTVEMAADDNVGELLHKNTDTNGQDYAIMRARVYEDGALATYGRARRGLPVEIGANERPEAIYQVEDVLRPFDVTPPFAAPMFEAGVHTCEIDVTVMDRDEFLEHFELSASYDDNTVANQLEGRFIEPFEERDFGASLREIRAAMDGEEMKVTITAEITDPRLLNQRVAYTARNCGYDDDYVPETAADAIFQAWCGLNDTPSPADLGLQINTWRTHVDTPSTDLGM
ncbi:hypothetical protein KUV57_12450 [Epibacterium sp. DP7N7-1]|nr:hypothetical protein [Epibacterium sp. DP7N7-1]